MTEQIANLSTNYDKLSLLLHRIMVYDSLFIGLYSVHPLFEPENHVKKNTVFCITEHSICITH